MISQKRCFSKSRVEVPRSIADRLRFVEVVGIVEAGLRLPAQVPEQPLLGDALRHPAHRPRLDALRTIRARPPLGAPGAARARPRRASRETAVEAANQSDAVGSQARTPGTGLVRRRPPARRRRSSSGTSQYSSWRSAPTGTRYTSMRWSTIALGAPLARGMPEMPRIAGAANMRAMRTCSRRSPLAVMVGTGSAPAAAADARSAGVQRHRRGHRAHALHGPPGGRTRTRARCAHQRWADGRGQLQVPSGIYDVQAIHERDGQRRQYPVGEPAGRDALSRRKGHHLEVRQLQERLRRAAGPRDRTEERVPTSSIPRAGSSATKPVANAVSRRRLRALRGARRHLRSAGADRRAVTCLRARVRRTHRLSTVTKTSSKTADADQPELDDAALSTGCESSMTSLSDWRARRNGCCSRRSSAAALGFERELRNKSAGLRTNILIAIGSALFTLMSIELADAADARSPAASRRRS